MGAQSPRERPGRFITFEGVEGSGKSTQLAALGRALAERGVSVVTTREPGGTPIGEAVRQLVLDPRFTGMSSRAELLLYGASRAEHVEHVILPALESGAIVLCDRFSEATVAYQAYGRGLPIDEVEAVIALATGGLRPDAVLLLDLPVDEGLRRVGRRALTNRLDLEPTGFHQRVRDGYLALAAREPNRIRLFDAGRPVEEVQRAILAMVEPLCQRVPTRSAR
ncbi:MAG: dTMP kinase [Nitrospirae bacterium]|nr:dTMP kinase [Nitrospirota bacterium]